MDKQQQFIAMVQTAFLANAINLSREPDALQHREGFSASAALIYMDEAIRASEMIPPKMSAVEAAHDFASYNLENLREGNMRVPGWYAR